MRTLERRGHRESLDQAIGRVAQAYGFSAPAVSIPRKSIADVGDDEHFETKTVAALISGTPKTNEPTEIWGTARHAKGTTLAFATLSAHHVIAHALVVKAALTTLEFSGLSDLVVLVSSIGDQESRKRFTRELNTFFRKNAEELSPEMKHIASRDPDIAYRALVEKKDPVVERMPRSVDFLSEASRKVMLTALSLFESVNIPYSISPRLIGSDRFQSELLIAIEGANRKGERVRGATGGRYDEYLKRLRGEAQNAIAMSVTLPKRVDTPSENLSPVCFVVHVGDIAKLKAFTVVEALWRAEAVVEQALLGETLRMQMERAQKSGARYIAIIGQREALDGTVIVRNLHAQSQSTIPLERLATYVLRGHHA